MKRMIAIVVAMTAFGVAGCEPSYDQDAYEDAMDESRALIAEMDADRDRPSVVSTGIYEVSAGLVVGASTSRGAINALGEPDSRSSLPGGGVLLQWVAVSPAASEHVALAFDRDGVLLDVQTRSRVAP